MPLGGSTASDEGAATALLDAPPRRPEGRRGRCPLVARPDGGLASTSERARARGCATARALRASHPALAPRATGELRGFPRFALEEHAREREALREATREGVRRPAPTGRARSSPATSSESSKISTSSPPRPTRRASASRSRTPRSSAARSHWASTAAGSAPGCSTSTNSPSPSGRATSTTGPSRSGSRATTPRTLSTGWGRMCRCA